MARVGSFDGEIGRGRRPEHSENDSESSSQGSSPVRSFRPNHPDRLALNSDDDIEITGEDKDTTPPPAGPLIRQAVAFSPPAQTISTYEATVEAAPKTAHFLPGQAVPLPQDLNHGGTLNSSRSANPTVPAVENIPQEVSLPPRTRAPRKTKTGIRRPRRPDAYPGQTSRFRLPDYDPTPSEEPHLAHGNGPYSSLYRGVAPTQEQQRQDSPNDVSTASGGQSSSTASSSGPVKTLGGVTSTDVSNGSAQIPTTDSGSSQPRGPSTLPAPPSGNSIISEKRPSSAPRENGSQNHDRAKHSGPTSPDGPSSGPSTYVTDTSLTMRERSSPLPHYRHDYNDKEFSPPRERRQSSTTSGAKPSSSSGQDKDSPSQKRKRSPLHLITLLIEDIRSGTPDLQLAEMSVPLRLAEDPSQGFWADAKDLAEHLQSGPSRIDGPARAYTLRGPYRQFILRVSAENVDEFVSTNVAVQPEKTINIFIETLLPPGAPPPRPPPIQREMYGPSHEDYDRRSEERMEVDPVRNAPSSRKRPSSPPFNEYDGYAGRSSHGGHSKVPRHDRTWERSPRHDPPPYAGSQRSITSALDHEPWRRSYPQEQPPSSYAPSYRRDSDSPPLPPPPPPIPPPPPLQPHPRLAQGLMNTSPGYPLRDDAGPSIPVRDSTTTVYPLRETSGPPTFRRREDVDDLTPADEPFIRSVDRLLREDHDAWDAYWRASASNRVCDIVKMYEFILRQCKKWVGKRPPGFNQPIDESHIARAMEIQNADTFLSKCKETMSLLDLYGRKGRTSQDARVAEMLDDMTPPAPNVDQSRKLLRLLRGIDDWFRNDRSTTLDGIKPPPPNQYGSPPPPSPSQSRQTNVTFRSMGPKAPPSAHDYPHTSPPQPPTQRHHSNPQSTSHSHQPPHPNPHRHSHSQTFQPPSSAESNGQEDSLHYEPRGKGMFVQQSNSTESRNTYRLP